MMEEVSKEMNGNEELCGRYFDFLEENKRINDSIINEERNKARKEGLEKGIQDTQKHIVLNMYNHNFAVEDISRGTGLEIEKIKSIIDNDVNN